MKNDLSILPRLDDAIATDIRDGRSDHDLTSMMRQSHWAYLSVARMKHPEIFLDDAKDSFGERSERIRDLLFSLN